MDGKLKRVNEILGFTDYPKTDPEEFPTYQLFKGKGSKVDFEEVERRQNARHLLKPCMYIFQKGEGSEPKLYSLHVARQGVTVADKHKDVNSKYGNLGYEITDFMGVRDYSGKEMEAYLDGILVAFYFVKSDVINKGKSYSDMFIFKGNPKSENKSSKKKS